MRRPELRRVLAVAAFRAGASAVYLAANRWHWREPAALPMTALDRAVPFSPWALPLYLSHFAFLPAALLGLSEQAFGRTLKAMLAALALCAAAFVAFPTAFPRPPAPGPVFALLAAVDTPASCFPSLHVALAALAAWGLRLDGARWAGAAALWAALIAASTVLVKQHYAADAAGGALAAVLALALTAPAAQPEPLGESA